jgi:hypothetical protein
MLSDGPDLSRASVTEDASQVQVDGERPVQVDDCRRRDDLPLDVARTDELEDRQRPGDRVQQR